MPGAARSLLMIPDAAASGCAGRRRAGGPSRQAPSTGRAGAGARRTVEGHRGVGSMIARVIRGAPPAVQHRRRIFAVLMGASSPT